MIFSTTLTLRTVTLRPHCAADQLDYMAIEPDEEYYRMLGLALPTLSRDEEAQRWMQRKLASCPAWAIEVEGKCIGSTRIHSIETENRRGRFAIQIFDPAYRGRGIGSATTAAVVRVAFEELELHRLDLRVLTINECAIRCYERCGFRREGVQRETVCLDGVWYSDLWMSILEEEYRGRE